MTDCIAFGVIKVAWAYFPDEICVLDADDVFTASIQKIEIMIKIFDYIFFRAIAFYKNHHDYDPEFAGVVVVVAFQFLLFIDFLILLNLAKLFLSSYPKQ